MFNVDTISLGFNLADIKYQNICNNFLSKRNYIDYMDNMFKQRLYRDSVNKAKLERLINQRNIIIVITDN